MQQGPLVAASVGVGYEALVLGGGFLKKVWGRATDAPATLAETTAITPDRTMKGDVQIAWQGLVTLRLWRKVACQHRVQIRDHERAAFQIEHSQH